MRGIEVTKMSIPGSSSERAIPESSLKIPPKTQSCKLHDSESRPNIMLEKIGQELDMAESKCLTLKSELNYMMDVCRKGQTEVKESKGTFDIPREQIALLFKNPGSKSSVENRNYTSAPNPKFARFSPRKNTNDDDVTECEILNEETQKRALNLTITPRTQLDKMLPTAITSIRVQDKTMKANATREYKSSLSSYPEHVREYLQSMLSIESSTEELISKTDEDYLCVIPSCVREEDIRRSELNLDTSVDTKARQAAKCKYASGTPGSETNSACKTSDAPFKMRKRKGKVRSSVSKSTVTTKDTCLIGRKEAKRRRNRGHGVTRQQSVPLKHAKKSNDDVEIVHNTTLKRSNSRASAKCSKLGRGAKYTKKQNLAETANQKTEEKSYSRHVTREHQSHNKENQQSLCLETLNRKNNPSCVSRVDRVTVDSVQEQNKSGKQFSDLSLETLHRESNPRLTADNRAQKQHQSEKHLDDSPTQCETHQRERTVCSSGFDDPIFAPNYEMPTLASKLKRSNRSYFGRFNFRNIPFVVSTSVTPSHNLGLNIQQVLSVMKTRQPMTNDIAPLLIRKVSRNVKPVSTLLEQINVQYEKSIFDLKSQTTGQLNNKESLNIEQDGRLSALELQHVGKAQSVRTAEPGIAKTTAENDSVSGQFCREKGDFLHEKYRIIKRQPSLVANQSSTLAHAKNQSRISRMSLNKEDNIGDHKTHTADSHNSKEIRDVLINLHDQFEEMNTRYEKLQSEMERSDDATLPKELSTLEKELQVKEEEIGAVISLYKEVMALKQQMKMLHKTGSLVCVATEPLIEPRRNPLPMSLASGKSHLTNIARNLGRRRGSNVYGATREPPASMQLAALLRQIQTFHKQLQLVS